MIDVVTRSPVKREDGRVPDKATILCVDEDARILSLRAALLSIAGYEVVTAADTEVALQLLASRHIDLVVTEYIQTSGGWQEFAGALKVHKPEVPILLYTALPEPPEGFRHADRLLAKGMNPSEFLSEIADLIAKSRG